jgi:glutamine amidotransferase
MQNRRHRLRHGQPALGRQGLKHVAPGCDVVVTADPQAIAGAPRIVLPGQSAMPDCIRALDATGLRDVVLRVARDRPFLGICLGCRCCSTTSEEGPTQALGVVPGRVVRFRDQAMIAPSASASRSRTWAGARCGRRGAPAVERHRRGTRFYFAHSYHPGAGEPAVTAATADYPAPFTCAIARANIFAVQFHPEKSHRAGLQLLANFVAWDGRA